MFRSWKIGTLFGIGIYVHATFLLLPLFVFFANLVGGQLGVALFALAMIPAVFGCVVLHELGHALMARHYGIETRDITLYPIGGVARLEPLPQRPWRPWEEFWIALAGPAVNVVIALGLGLALFPAALHNPTAFVQSIAEGNILAYLFVANVFLVAFNMLPAYPMDGGRVLRALLATQLGHLEATTVAVRVGFVMAIFFVFPGVLLNPMFPVIGIFIMLIGQQELAMLRYRQTHGRRELLEALPVEDEDFALPRPASPGSYSGFTWDDRGGHWVEWRNGRPVHTISVE
jgi:Zn-dependent protease